MWRRVSEIMKPAETPAQGQTPALDKLPLGMVLQFSPQLPPQVAGKKGTVSGIRTYRFGEETTLTYSVTLASGERYMLAVARDEQGFYLGLMRELSSAEQRLWFDPDALSFFTEQTTAKTLKCRADLAKYGTWAAPKYVKTVDFLNGDVMEGRNSSSEIVRKPRPLQYSMLLDDTGEKALEIEVYPEHGNVRVFATLFLPEEVVEILPGETLDAEEEPIELSDILREEMNEDAVESASAEIIPISPAVAIKPVQTAAEVPLFAEPVEAYIESHKPAPTPAPQPVVQPEAVRAKRPDFKRLSVTEVSALSPDEATLAAAEASEGAAPIPSFLLEPHEYPRSLLEELLQPDALHLRCDTVTAQKLLNKSLTERKPVREVLREILGLSPAVRDEVIFELPLSARESEALAMHFQIRPDKDAELRQRILEEIRRKLR